MNNAAWQLTARLFFWGVSEFSEFSGFSEFSELSEFSEFSDSLTLNSKL